MPTTYSFTAVTSPENQQPSVWEPGTEEETTPPVTGLFVSAGAMDSAVGVMTSPDGITFTDRVESNAANWRGLAFNGSDKIVAVADGGTGNRAMSSPDGINWTTRVCPAVQWTAVAYGEGLFVAVGSDSWPNNVMTSPDGETWTQRLGTFSTVVARGIIYSPELGIFVSVGSSGSSTDRLATSPDGIVWTQVAVPDSNINDMRSVCWSAELGLFCAVGAHPNNQTYRIITSPDGVNWTAQNDSMGNVFRTLAGVCWSKDLNLFCAVGRGFSNNSGYIITSPDGVNWSVQTVASFTSLRAIKWGNGLFVAVGDVGATRIQTSPDGITWTAQAAPAVSFWDCITICPGL